MCRVSALSLSRKTRRNYSLFSLSLFLVCAIDNNSRLTCVCGALGFQIKGYAPTFSVGNSKYISNFKRNKTTDAIR